MSQAKQQAQAALASRMAEMLKPCPRLRWGWPAFLPATRLAADLAKRFPEDTIVAV